MNSITHFASSTWKYISTQKAETNGSAHCQTKAEYEKSSSLWKIFKAIVDPSPISKGTAVGFIVSEFSHQIANVGTPLSGAIAGIGAYTITDGFNKCKDGIYAAQKELSLLAKTVIHLGSITLLCQVIPDSIEAPGKELVQSTASKVFLLMKEIPFLNRFEPLASSITKASITLAEPTAKAISSVLSNITPLEVEAGPIALATAVGASYLGYRVVSASLDQIKKYPSVQPIINVGEKVLSSLENQTQTLVNVAPILLTCYFNNRTYVKLNEGNILPNLNIATTTLLLSLSHIIYNYKWPMVKKDTSETVLDQSKANTDANLTKVTNLSTQLERLFGEITQASEGAKTQHRTGFYANRDTALDDIAKKSSQAFKACDQIDSCINKMEELQLNATGQYAILKKQLNEKDPSQKKKLDFAQEEERSIRASLREARLLSDDAKRAVRDIRRSNDQLCISFNLQPFNYQ